MQASQVHRCRSWLPAAAQFIVLCSELFVCCSGPLILGKKKNKNNNRQTTAAAPELIAAVEFV